MLLSCYSVLLLLLGAARSVGDRVCSWQVYTDGSTGVHELRGGELVPLSVTQVAMPRSFKSMPHLCLTRQPFESMLWCCCQLCFA